MKRNIPFIDPSRILYNGRVDITDYPIAKPFSMFVENETTRDYVRNEVVGSYLQSNPLQVEFFSNKNIENIQQSMIQQISNQYQYKIGKQSDNELIIIMKSIYLTHGRNMPTQIKEQVDELNRKVLDYAIPNILNNIKQHLGYRRDISTLPIPMNLPSYQSSAGTRTTMRQSIF